MCYGDSHHEGTTQEILERVFTWPPERQADVAEVVALMEIQNRSGLQLTHEQAAEVRRRLAHLDSDRIPAEQVF